MRMIFVIVVALVAFGVLSPYLIIARKRSRMLRRLSAVARKAGFRVRRLHRFVCFSPNTGRGYDLLFETNTHAYAVKLWSAHKKNAILTVKNGKVCETVQIGDAICPEEKPARRISTRERRVPVTRNNFRVRRGKPVVGIMLLYPPYKEIVAQVASGVRTINVGDKLFDKQICLPINLEQLLGQSKEVTVATE